MKAGFRNVAQRMVNAEADFIDTLCELGGINREQARRVLARYRKDKIVRADAVLGRLLVVHGAFLDRDTIRNAVAS